MIEQEIKTTETLFIILVVSIIFILICLLIRDAYIKIYNKKHFKKLEQEQQKETKKTSAVLKLEETRQKVKRPAKAIIKKILLSTRENKGPYFSKPLMTECEIYFYKIIYKHYGEKYLVMPQVPLSSIINKQKQYEWEYQNELFRTIDFGLINRKTLQCDLLIEINDKTHTTSKRRDRDEKVRKICKTAGIPIITFWTSQPNSQQYILKKINENIRSNNERRDI